MPDVMDHGGNWLQCWPWLRQQKAYEVSHDKEAFALFMEPSTGKSYVILLTAAQLYLEGKIQSLLIFAPNLVHRQWVEDEIISRMPRIPYMAGWYSSKQSKMDRAKLDDITRFKGLRILAMNLESMSHTSGYNFAADWLHKAGPGMVVIDESQHIKSPSSTITHNFWRLRSKMKASKGKLAGQQECVLYRRILSGEPKPQGLEDLYAQFRFLDEDILQCRTFAEFKAWFCQMALVAGFPKIVGYTRVPKMRALLAPFVYAVKKDNIPPRLWRTRYVELSLEQAKAYHQMKTEYQTELANGKWIVAEQAITRIRRLQQIVSGHITSSDAGARRDISELPCPRFEAVLALVGELSSVGNGKVIVWAEERFEIERLRRTFDSAGIDCVTYYGGDSDRAKMANKEKFLSDPACKVFISNPASGGEGLNLQVAGNAIYFSHGWSWGDRYQSENRPHRPGLEQVADSMVYWDLIAKGTIDEKIRKRVKQKQDVSAMLDNLDVVRDLLEVTNDGIDPVVVSSVP